MPSLGITPEVRLEYLDSENESEIILVIVHGHSWGAGSFRRCIDVAPLHGVRVVAINRRGFGKSTPLTAQDIQLLRSGKLGNHTVFLQDRARELGNFIIALQRHGICGRFFLVGWSLGNAFCLKLVQMLEDGKLGNLGEQLKGLLKAYIIYDAPYWTLSFQPPTPASASYAAQITAPVPLPRKHLALNHWLSAYFTYPPVDVPSDPSKLVLMDTFGNTQHPTSLQSIIKDGLFGPLELNPGELSGGIRDARKAGYTPGATRDDNAILQCIATGAFDIAPNKVLFSASLEKGLLPIMMMWGERSTWILFYAAFRMHQLIDLNPNKVRLSRMICIQNGNHFSHWDRPDLFLDICLDIVNGLSGKVLGAKL